MGLLVSLVGLIELAFAWWPLEFGNLEWEFGTVSRTFDGLPLLTVGAAAILGGAVHREARKLLALLGIVAGLGVLVLVGLAVFYAITIPAAMQIAPPPVQQALVEASVRTGMFMLLYISGYTWMSWFSFRSSRKLRRRKDSR